MAKIVIRCQYSGHYIFTGIETRPDAVVVGGRVLARIAQPITSGPATRRGSTIRAFLTGSRWFARRADACAHKLLLFGNRFIYPTGRLEKRS